MAAWRRKGGLEKFEQRLIDGMAARGYAEEFARQIYQQILGFGEYGFPESHSASFALLVYISSWLKHYEPAAFCGALLNSQPMGFYAPAQLVADARRHGVDVRPVDVTISEWNCTLEEGALRLGLRMVKGLTEAGAKRIVEARGAAAFESVTDLAHRAKLDRRDLAALADADALVPLSGHRHDAVWEVAGVERLPEILAGATFVEMLPTLPAPTEGQEIVADYRRLAHAAAPSACAVAMATVTGKSSQRRHLAHAAWTVHARRRRHGRQRPDTKSGVFLTRG
jgi:error-prone DNA polymerase